MGIACCGPDNKTLDARIEQEHIRLLYDRIAPLYDIWAILTESNARNRALELAAIQDGQSILEVAVGTGLAFYEIVKRNPNGINIGVDLSKGMLEKAKRRLRGISGANYTLAVGTAFHLGIKDESIDTLTNHYMLDLIPFSDMDNILLEYRRVLKKNGKLIMVNMTEGERFGSKIYDVVYSISPKTMGGCRGIKLKERLQQLGFSVEAREYYQQMLFPSEVIVAYKAGV
ncbi:MAG: methyltransferase domain-containing protein [Oscillochloridaceae bacterium]|nr:methyltransferase domain-containing protein [Chloroflexaceae bacterium]MDW8390059.1 methyltransferase domain-containing protein [Oscillochloridaceae bacterium]